VNRRIKIFALIIIGFVLLGLSSFSGDLFGQENSRTGGYALAISTMAVFVYALILEFKKESDPNRDPSEVLTPSDKDL